MTAFVDTNWIVASYFQKNEEGRTETVERFMRKHGQPLILSHIVLLECSNTFKWMAKKNDANEWSNFEADIGRKFLVDTMQWDMLRQKTNELFRLYSQARIGTFDTAIIASAILTGAQLFLSFDSQCRALAAAQKLKVFPELSPKEKAMLAELR